MRNVIVGNALISMTGAWADIMIGVDQANLLSEAVW
jgi:hypothetical protein